MAYTFAALRPEYAALWSTMTIDPARDGEILSVVRKMQAGMAQYQAVSRVTGVPAAVIAVIHQRESGGDFRTHLHNGDPLSARTVNVPAGRPVDGKPPFTWEESGVDALRYEGLDKIMDWSVERAAFVLEGYNGFGYRNHGLRSPYLWGGSNQQQSGKYVADGKLDATVMDRQLGCMPLLRRLWDLSPELGLTPSADQPAVPAPAPPMPPLAPVTPRPAPPPDPIPPSSTMTPAKQGAIAAAVAALVGGLALFGHQVADWFAHLFGG